MTDEHVNEPRWIEFSRLVPHQLNPNELPPEYEQKLATHIAATGLYPHLIARPLEDGTFQILDGHWRARVLERLGERGAWCQVWPVDDGQALVLLATLNRLSGEDVEGRRAALVGELAAHRALAELAELLPESEAQLQSSLEASQLDVEELLASLTESIDREIAAGPRPLTFAVPAGEVALVEQAIGLAMTRLEGRNRRGRALGQLATAYLGGADE